MSGSSVLLSRLLSQKSQSKQNMSSASPPPSSSQSVQSAASPGGSITSAFRQLQHKCRNVEIGRADALRERDEMQRLINEQTRSDSLHRSRLAASSAETLLDMKTQANRVVHTLQKLGITLTEVEHDSTVVQNESFDRQKKMEVEEAETERTRAHLHALSSKVRDYEREIAMLHDRTSKLEGSQQQQRLLAAEAEARAKENVVNLELELTRSANERVHAKARADALQTYMRLLLNINKDLCDAAYAREQAEVQMKKFVIIPRYSWPKGKVRAAQEALTGMAAEHALEIKRRRDVRAANKTFKDSLARTATAKATPPRKRVVSGAGSGSGAGAKKPTRAVSSVSAGGGGGRKKKQAQNMNSVLHDTALRAVSSRKVGESVRSMWRRSQ